MIKFDAEDDRSELEYDRLDDYPEEVLESEWNPVIAQMQRLKRHSREIPQQTAALWLSLPDMPIEN